MRFLFLDYLKSRKHNTSNATHFCMNSERWMTNSELFGQLAGVAEFGASSTRLKYGTTNKLTPDQARKVAPELLAGPLGRNPALTAAPKPCGTPPHVIGNGSGTRHRRSKPSQAFSPQQARRPSSKRSCIRGLLLISASILIRRERCYTGEHIVKSFARLRRARPACGARALCGSGPGRHRRQPPC